MPGIFEALARLTCEQAWARAASAAVTLIGELTDNGETLPPDWAQLSGGQLVPIGAPGGSAGVQYGLDAARLPIWFATARDPAARDLAANWWHNVLGSEDRWLPLSLGLRGETINPSGSPLTILAGAAAAGMRVISARRISCAPTPNSSRCAFRRTTAAPGRARPGVSR